MLTKCPYCGEQLRIELTAQIVEQVDPNVMGVYEEFNRRRMSVAQQRGGLFGGMMKMSAGMAQSMMGLSAQYFELIMKSRPMVQILIEYRELIFSCFLFLFFFNTYQSTYKETYQLGCSI